MSARIKLVSLGFDDVKGREAMGCVHLAQWFPWVRLLVLLTTGVDLQKIIVQATGDAPESAGTHDGPSLDIRTRGLSKVVILTIVAILRAAGARATWFRTGPKWVNNNHIHCTLDCSCPSAADYQTRAADRGRDGLASNGPDPHDPPLVRRDFTTGLAYVLKEIEMTATLPTAQQIADAVLAAPITANGETESLRQHLATLFVDTAAQSGAVETEKKRDKAAAELLVAVRDEIRNRDRETSGKLDEIRNRDLSLLARIEELAGTLAKVADPAPPAVTP